MISAIVRMPISAGSWSCRCSGMVRGSAEVEEDFIVFATAGGVTASEAAEVELHEFRLEMWRPRAMRWVPSGLGRHFAVWSLLHYLRVLRNRGLAVLLIWHEDRLVHHTCLIPKWWRWPFMKSGDVQISDMYTDVAYRGQGLATYAVRLLVDSVDRSTVVWYSARESNAASLDVAEKLGMHAVGTAQRTTRLRSRLLGQLRVTSWKGEVARAWVK